MADAQHKGGVHSEPALKYAENESGDPRIFDGSIKRGVENSSPSQSRRWNFREIARDLSNELIIKSLIMIRILIDSSFLILWVLIRNKVHHLLESHTPQLDKLGGWQLLALEIVFDVTSFSAVVFCVVHDLRGMLRRIWRTS